MPLMTEDEYSRIKHKTPYVYKIQTGKQFLYYFGEKHSFNPDDSQWVQVRNFFSDFVKNTENQKRIAFVEAGRPPVKETENGSILEAGGTGLITFLASQLNIEVYCPEPSRVYEIRELEKQFSREEIEYYYFARIVNQWGRIPDPKPKFEEYVSRFLERDEKNSGWNDFDFSYENLKRIHRNMFKAEFNENNSSFFRELVTPVDLKTTINKVSRASGVIRENYIINEISKYWDNGYSIFIEYGSSHAVIQEPLLKEMLSK